MPDSKIPSIPTTYKDVHFRSRLEAKWAALFDLVGWKWQYEPIDLEGYIPDFILEGTSSILVEVKPELTLAGLEKHTKKIEESSWKGEALLLGTRPFETLFNDDKNKVETAGLGLLGDKNEAYISARWEWGGTVLSREPDDEYRWDFCSDWGRYDGRIYAADRGGHPIWLPSWPSSEFCDEVKLLWSQASNAVRWSPRK